VQYILSQFNDIILLPTFITAQIKCETDDDCPEVEIYDLRQQPRNLQPSIFKCIDNLCSVVAVE
jgi:hypothetical protein